MDRTTQNELAKKLKALYVPGEPVLFANVWDAASTALVAKNSATAAIATASYAIAATQGADDNDMSLFQNLVGIKNCVAGLMNAGKQQELPISADLQDGYEDVAETIKLAIEIGVVGANIEDVLNKTRQIRSVEDNMERIRTALKSAADAGVPDFVINARTDILGFGGDIADVIERGEQYLQAGATAVFVWGVGKWDIKADEVQQMVKAFGGRLAVQPGSIGIEKLKQLGVSRVSVGPALWRLSMGSIESEAQKLGLF